MYEAIEFELNKVLKDSSDELELKEVSVPGSHFIFRRTGCGGNSQAQH